MGLVSVAVWVLTVAVAAGTILALWHLRATDAASRPPLAAGIAHGLVGAAGFAALLVAVRGPPRGVDTGVGSFGIIASALFAGAIGTGVAVLLLRRKPIVMAVHAGIAITGYVLLLAWNALG
ncbi:MAG TPA: hypothetical protein DDZ81_00165 [Acetobacteraceae bacterium]|jgi:hypothetical protein|nr:hypothetical protein [Acetobacteraceae bacterium]